MKVFSSNWWSNPSRQSHISQSHISQSHPYPERNADDLELQNWKRRAIYAEDQLKCANESFRFELERSRYETDRWRTAARLRRYELSSLLAKIENDSRDDDSGDHTDEVNVEVNVEKKEGAPLAEDSIATRVKKRRRSSLRTE